MAKFIFPSNPNIGDLITNPASGQTFRWDGQTWSGDSAQALVTASFAFTASYYSGSISNAVSAAYADTASYVDITGSGVIVNYNGSQIQLTASAGGGNLQEVTTLGGETSASVNIYSDSGLTVLSSSFSNANLFMNVVDNSGMALTSSFVFNNLDLGGIEFATMVYDSGSNEKSHNYAQYSDIISVYGQDTITGESASIDLAADDTSLGGPGSGSRINIKATTVDIYNATITGSLYGTSSWSENTFVALNSKGNTVDVKAAMALTTGQIAHIFGADGTNLLITTASYESDLLSANTLGVVTASVATNGFASIVTFGPLGGLNTSAFTAGDLLYLGASGSITNVRPLAPLHAVRLGYVTKVSAGNGEIFVKVDNGYEIDELHDVLITQVSGSQLLMRSGSVWVNTSQLSGSYQLTGSLDMSGSMSLVGSLNVIGDITASVFTTQYTTSSISVITGSSKFGSTGSNSHEFTGSVNIITSVGNSPLYNREIHVSSGSGDDINGKGTLTSPFKTITKALTVLGNTGEALIIHPGTYRENITVSQLNVNILNSAGNTGGIAFISGSVTITANTPASSLRFNGLMMRSLIHSGSSPLYLDYCNVRESYTKSSNASFSYINNSTTQAVNITGAGSVTFTGGQITGLTIDNPSAQVLVKDSYALTAVTANRGVFSANSTNIYTAVSGTAAINATTASVTYLFNSQIFQLTSGTPERINISGSFGYENVIFNRALSTTGSRVGVYQTAYFQDIIADNITGSGFPFTGSARISGSLGVTGSMSISGGILQGTASHALSLTQYCFSGSGNLVTGSNFTVGSFSTLGGPNFVLSSSFGNVTSSFTSSVLNGIIYNKTRNVIYTKPIAFGYGIDPLQSNASGTFFYFNPGMTASVGDIVTPLLAGTQLPGTVECYNVTSSFTSNFANTASYIDVTGSGVTVNWSGSQLQLTASAGGKVTIQSTPPVPSSSGDLWYDSDDANLYVLYSYISASTTASAWVPVTSQTVSSTSTSGVWAIGQTVWGATTTAPTKATTRETDYLRYRNSGTKQWEIDWGYYSSNSTGAALGSGDYLFTLPGGLQFDTSIHKTYTGVLGTAIWQYLLPADSGATGYNDGSFGTTGVTIIPYSATQYRVCYWESQTAPFVLRMLNSNIATSTRITTNGYFLYYKFSFTATT